MNVFAAQNKIILSMTVPPRDKWIGFGFDLNGTVATGLMSLTNRDTVLEVWDHKQVQPALNRFLDISSSLSQSILSI
jgi:hypothetical protein